MNDPLSLFPLPPAKKTSKKLGVVRMIGSSTHSKEERAEYDFYATDPNSVQLFLDRISKDNDWKLNNELWECSCGTGHISKTLEMNGYKVFSSDLINRGYPNHCQTVINFPKTNYSFDGDIFTNPPYKTAIQFVENAHKVLHNGNNIIMYLRLNFLEGNQRRKLLDKFPPRFVYIHSRRQTTYKNGGNTESPSAICFAWFVWTKGIKTEPIIRWI